MKFHLSQFTSPRGFTLIELMVTMGIIIALASIATVSLANYERKSSIASQVNSMIPDIKEQQIKAMSGDSEGSGSIQSYGVHISATSYTLFRGTYVAGSSSNFVVNIPSNITLSTTFPSSEILFAKGSGEVTGPNTITVTDGSTGQTKTITFNKYGTITSVN